MRLAAQRSCSVPSTSGRQLAQPAAVSAVPCHLRARPFLAGETPLPARRRAVQQDRSSVQVAAVAAPEQKAQTYGGGKVVKVRGGGGGGGAAFTSLLPCLQHCWAMRMRVHSACALSSCNMQPPAPLATVAA